MGTDRPTPRTPATAPIDPAIVQQASIWMARLWSGQATEADRAACQQWRAAHPEHERAWQVLQAFDQTLDRKLGTTAHPVSRQVLLEPALQNMRTRRRVLRSLVLGVSVGSLVAYGRQTETWQLVRAEHSSRMGEIRSLTLADGSQLVLASASAIDVDYTPTMRRIWLRAGEIMLTTAADAHIPARPLSVVTRHGSIQALGTRFSVQQHGDETDVQVFEGAVEIRPTSDSASAVRIHAGQGIRFDHQTVQQPQAIAPSTASWTQGLLVADGMRLDTFVQALARYRTGVLRCDPSIAHLRVTGVFPLYDTDRALHNLTLGLPVRISRRTGYWVSVVPR